MSFKQKSNRIFQLIELFRVVGKLENSVEVARALKEEGNCPKNLKPFFLTNYAYTLVLYAQSFQSLDERMPFVEEVFPLLHALSDGEQSIIFQKTLAIALEIVQKFVILYAFNFYSIFSVDSTQFADICQQLNLSAFGISNRLELVEKRVTALTFILNSNLTFSDSWNDLALCLSELASLSGDDATLDK